MWGTLAHGGPTRGQKRETSGKTSNQVILVPIHSCHKYILILYPVVSIQTIVLEVNTNAIGRGQSGTYTVRDSRYCVHNTNDTCTGIDK